MGEYEPRDSRIVTQNPSGTPVEPERTGPREEEARREATPPRKDAAGDTPQTTGEGQDNLDRWQVKGEDRR
ncbi:hypothetical protein AEB_P1937 [Altererythrobacter sp. B11]|uniref:hypothetical protein n=1 Tax=Altererythrobacter sp. B11 TaxID=2060312 RepID=UPI000DC6FA06|nr:hypothetical protein [Altererythrobacter sp. B11]BBC72805.1 hypothetical protein AEB_P1937 [Altererythrobacter sp. B11]